MKRFLRTLTLVSLFSSFGAAQNGPQPAGGAVRSGRPVHTFSIVARDPITELKRLVRYHRAYVHMQNGDDCSTKKTGIARSASTAKRKSCCPSR